jgi:hypothetical protein
VREHILDPLAQDLLMKMLLPADERLPTITAVLRHPFFFPKSDEAKRLLEKHEEMQLLRDNTVTVIQVNEAMQRIFDDSMEKYCKIAFEMVQIAFPCALMMLPYTINSSQPSNPKHCPATKFSLAARIGECFLEINKATARMSFWLRMGVKMRGQDSSAFKIQIQEWLKRAQTESCASIAIEIVSGLDCDVKYAMICEEVLTCDGQISKAKAYMRDPIKAAQREIKQQTNKLYELYQPTSYLYLVDEVTMLLNGASSKSGSYPIELEISQNMVNCLLPFMNIVVMKALAKAGFEGLSNLLDLPTHFVDASWKSLENGLVHSMDNSESIEEFVLLQRIIRTNDHVYCDDGSQSHHSGTSASSSVGSSMNNLLSYISIIDIDLTPGDSSIASIPMELLELHFRQNDPDRQFGELRRVVTSVASKSSKNYGIWTSIDSIRQMQIYDATGESDVLVGQVLPIKDATTAYYTRKSDRPMNYADESSLHRMRQMSSRRDEYIKELNHRMATQHDNTSTAQDEVDDANDKQENTKAKKSNRRFRPWFTAC